MTILDNKTSIYQIQTADSVSPAIANAPHGNIETNIDAIRSYLNSAITGHFEQNVSTTTGLTFGYRAGAIRNGTTINIANAGTLVLTASNSNYIEVNSAGVVSANTTSFTTGKIPLWLVTTNVSSITSVIDKRVSTTFVNASDVINTPAGNIASTDVQSAINELDSEKLALAGGTMSGALNMGSHNITSMTDPVNAQDSATKNYVDNRDTAIFNSAIAVAKKNVIINGNFNIWQRGTTQTSITGYGSDDRWVNGHIGSTKTHSQQAFTLGQTDVPHEPTYYSRTVVTSVAGAGNAVYKDHYIESVRTFAGQTATLSFYAKADANKNMALDFAQIFGTGGTPSADVSGIGVTTIPLTTAWQKFTVTVAIPSISGKTIGTNGNDTLTINFFFDAGSNFNARTNSLGQQSGTFDIAQVQFEAGSVATPFEQRSIGEELNLCYRYYYKTIDSTVGLVTVGSGNSVIIYYNLPVRLRTTPTLSHNLTDANFANGVATGSGTWGLQSALVSYSSRTGTFTFNAMNYSYNWFGLCVTGATLSNTPNTFVPGAGIFMDASAEF